jgi:hypothetical protein
MNLDPQQIESLLACRGDGPLGAEEIRALDEALRTDPVLAALAGQYERLDRLLARIKSDGPTVSAAALCERIRAALREEVEFQISQRLDGELAADAAARLAEVAARDPGVHAAQDDYGRLHRRLKAHSTRQPAVDHARLSRQIGQAVRREALRQRAAGRPRRRMVVGGPLALAASLLLAVVLWQRSAGGPGSDGVSPPAPAAPSVVVVRLAVPQNTGNVYIALVTQMGESSPQSGVAVAFDTLGRPEHGVIVDSGPKRGIISGGSERRTPVSTSNATALALMF